jgi:hypothetical protein
MEPWDRSTVESEIALFRARGELKGLIEDEIRRLFGEPDLVMTPGVQETSPDGKVIFAADKDLRYFQLLPHTCVNISVLDGRVGRVGYWAKWRICPAEKREALGLQYAPA